MKPDRPITDISTGMNRALLILFAVLAIALWANLGR